MSSQVKFICIAQNHKSQIRLNGLYSLHSSIPCPQTLTSYKEKLPQKNLLTGKNKRKKPNTRFPTGTYRNRNVSSTSLLRPAALPTGKPTCSLLRAPEGPLPKSSCQQSVLRLVGFLPISHQQKVDGTVGLGAPRRIQGTHLRPPACPGRLPS